MLSPESPGIPYPRGVPGTPYVIRSLASGVKYAVPGIPQHCFSVTVHGLPAEYPAFLAQCRLSLRETNAAFAERKATLATRERLR